VCSISRCSTPSPMSCSTSTCPSRRSSSAPRSPRRAMRS
jgi:hypothetical protein